MFTQFFGSFLLNNKTVTSEQLKEAMAVKSQTRVKLGVLAINAGYMTAAQVEKVHIAQQQQDKRIGDLAVEMGFLTEKQIDELLSAQKTGTLLLGQALVDLGFMTNEQFETALNDYKKLNALNDGDFTSEQNEKANKVIAKFYDFDISEDEEFYTDYVNLLFKNIVRFIGDDFTPLTPVRTDQYLCSQIASQRINGSFNAYTAIEGIDTSFIGFASRFAEEKLTNCDDFTMAAMSEFLNLNNGLFTVNMSNSKNVELSLEPQEIEKNITLKTTDNTYLIPISFTFGTVVFIISKS